jgi:hypothetical protein
VRFVDALCVRRSSEAFYQSVLRERDAVERRLRDHSTPGSAKLPEPGVGRFHPRFLRVR